SNIPRTPSFSTSFPTRRSSDLIVVIALLAVAVGLACGIGNALLVTVGRIPAIIATLATLAIYRGLVFEVTHGQDVFASQLPPGLDRKSTRLNSSHAWTSSAVCC